jgi:hypothetical protein
MIFAVLQLWLDNKTAAAQTASLYIGCCNQNVAASQSTTPPASLKAPSWKRKQTYSCTKLKHPQSLKACPAVLPLTRNATRTRVNVADAHCLPTAHVCSVF